MADMHGHLQSVAISHVKPRHLVIIFRMITEIIESKTESCHIFMLGFKMYSFSDSFHCEKQPKVVKSSCYVTYHGS
jgi:hypothetical protein